jgi:transcriptional regulator with XRE-family HTH domain
MRKGASNAIGERLKEMGKSQSWLARKSGLSRAEISALVNQKISDPSIQTVIAVRRALHCPLERLFFYLDEPSVKHK